MCTVVTVSLSFEFDQGVWSQQWGSNYRTIHFVFTCQLKCAMTCWIRIESKHPSIRGPDPVPSPPLDIEMSERERDKKYIPIIHSRGWANSHCLHGETVAVCCSRQRVGSAKPSQLTVSSLTPVNSAFEAKVDHSLPPCKEEVLPLNWTRNVCQAIHNIYDIW